MFIDPAGPDAVPDASLAMSPEFRSSGFSDLRLNSYTSGLYQFDEVRIGTTFEDIRSRR
jgi:hypothetical protein